MASTLLDVCGNDRTERDGYVRRTIIAFLAGYASYKHTTTAHTPFLSSASLFKCGAAAATAAALPRGSDVGAADVGVDASCC